MRLPCVKNHFFTAFSRLLALPWHLMAAPLVVSWRRKR